MIIKHIKRRSKGSPIGSAGFKKVIRYVLREGVPGKAEGQGVRAWGIEGCVSDTESLQRKEMAAVIEQNQSAKGDRYYHVIVALQKGESLSSESWKNIAERLGEKIGFSSHHCVWAIHIDTEHEHMHVVFSKIHPERFTLHEPYLAYKKFRELIKECESEFHLGSTKQKQRNVPRGGPGNEMEQHRGELSLLSWVHAEIGEQLSLAIRGGHWSSVQDVLLQRGLEVRERGRGYVIVDVATSATIKFSDVARTLSVREEAKRLEGFSPRSLGATASVPLPATGDTNYGWRPTSHDAVLLRQEYERERQQLIATRQQDIASIKRERDQEISQERARYREAAKREKDQALQREGDKRHRREGSLLRYLGVKARLEQYYRRKAKDVNRRTRVRSWKQYLTDRSIYDPLALRVLREHEARRQRGIQQERRIRLEGALRM